MPPVPIKILYTFYSTADFSRPETFQTFSFGTNVYETSAIRFAGKKTEKTSNAAMKSTYLLVSGTNLATKSVLGNVVLDENYCFFIFFLLNPLEYVLIAVSQNLVFIGFDKGTITGVG